MALTKNDRKLESVQFVFSDGNLTDLICTINFAVLDDTLPEDAQTLTRVRRSVSLWGELTTTEQGQLDTVAKKIISKLAAAV